MKRKTSPDSVELKLPGSTNKKPSVCSSDGKILFQKLPTQWHTLPTVLWILLMSFIDQRDQLRIARTNSLFMNLYNNYYRQTLHGKTLPDLNLFMSRFKNIERLTQWREFAKLNKKMNNYLSLQDPTYAPLFIALHQYDQETAIDFIRNKLKTGVSILEIVAEIFIHQKIDGESAIILAKNLQLKDFLNFCFQELILSNQNFDAKLHPKNKFILPTTGKLEKILETLETRMTQEVLMFFAYAHACDREDICQLLSTKPHWKKTYNIVPCISLSLAAAFLGDVHLIAYALDGISENELSEQMHLSFLIKKHQLNYNNRKISATPLAIACMTNHKVMIESLLPISIRSMEDDDENDSINCLVPFLVHCIRTRKLTELKDCLNKINDGNLLIHTIGISPEYLEKKISSKLCIKEDCLMPEQPYRHTVLDLVIASEWVEGIYLIFETAARCIMAHEDTQILYHTLFYDHLHIFQQLIKHNVSLNIKYPVRYSNYLEYPYITAIRITSKEKIINYIEEKFDKADLREQILDRLKNVEDDDDSDLSKDLLERLDALAPALARRSSSLATGNFPLLFLPNQSGSQDITTPGTHLNTPDLRSP